ncbi:hypothetical protein K438DRAFT_1800932 [Mycena galopus ATCC 62051]|nr:hypothetical protein K438DRAFT_1800932 [Mycena galopus ATCC 62051]
MRCRARTLQADLDMSEMRHAKRRQKLQQMELVVGFVERQLQRPERYFGRMVDVFEDGSGGANDG